MIWRQIPDCHYAGSDLGHIKNLTTERILKPVKRKNGYLVVIINGKQYYVHRLILFAFTGILGEEVNHLNRNKIDNRLCNLEWVNRKQNSQHYWRMVRYEMEAEGQMRLL